MTITIDRKYLVAIIVAYNYRANKFSSQELFSQNVDNFYFCLCKKLLPHRWSAESDEGNDDRADERDQ